MRSKSKLLAGVVMIASAMSLAACSSSGTSRLASIGAGDGPGASNSGGNSGNSGSDGSGNGGQTGGDTGGGTGSSGSTTASLPLGSLTGPTGVANTGILPSTGQAGEPSPLAPVLATAGNAALGLADATGQVTGALGGAGSILSPVTSAVQQTLANSGTALNNGATGAAPLVDGLTKAVAPVATVALGGTTLLGDGSGSSLVAVSTGSPATGSGSLADLHLAKDTAMPAASNLLGAQVAGATLASPSGTPAINAQVLTPNAPTASALGVGVASGGQLVNVTAPGLTGANPLGATGAAGGVTGLTNTAAQVTGPLKGLVGGLLHH